jgi:hypothetical protein
MSTATATHHHFPHPIAFAAAATAVVIGGAAAVGIAVSQDHSTSAPSQSHVKAAQEPARGGSHNSRSIDEVLKHHALVPPPVRGGTQLGMP